MTKILLALLVLLGCLATPVHAQVSTKRDEMQTLLDLTRERKKQVVELNMDLTPAEATQFWPIYEIRQDELAKINRRLLQLISRYAKSYSSDAISDEEALSLLREAMDIDAAHAVLNKSNEEQLLKVIPGKKVVRYMQIERKIRAAVNYGLADNIPLVK